jgi:CheY-like chemotaxis protein
VLDIEMPVKNGLETAKEIRKVEIANAQESIRITGLTSNAREAQVAAGIEAGMNFVVTKPYNIDFLLKQLVSA